MLHIEKEISSFLGPESDHNVGDNGTTPTLQMSQKDVSKSTPGTKAIKHFPISEGM